MGSAKSAGRVLGILLLLHLVAGLMVPFMVLHPVILSRDGFLVSAAANAAQLRTAVFMFIVGSAIPIGVSVVLYRRYSSGMGLWLCALAVVAYTLQMVDNAALLSMLSLSQQLTDAGASKAETFQSLSLVVVAARRWSHYMALFFAVSWLALVHAFMYRFQVVPRVLAALGVTGCVLQISGVTLRGLLGYAPEMRLAMPLAPIYVTVALWLLVKGIDEAKSTAHSETLRRRAAGE